MLHELHGCGFRRQQSYDVEDFVFNIRGHLSTKQNVHLLYCPIVVIVRSNCPPVARVIDDKLNSYLSACSPCKYTVDAYFSICLLHPWRQLYTRQLFLRQLTVVPGSAFRIVTYAFLGCPPLSASAMSLHLTGCNKPSACGLLRSQVRTSRRTSFKME